MSKENEPIYEFQTDWFSRYIPLWEQVLGHLEDQPALNFLEVGSFEGRSAIWLLENILSHPTARITCIDHFQGSMEDEILGIDSSHSEEAFRSNIEKGRFSEKVTVMKGESRRMLKQLPEGTFDFIYIDGSHVAPDVLTDAILSFYLLKRDGILCFDDYYWEEVPDELDRPRIAIKAFLEIFQRDIELIHKGEQVFVRCLRDFSEERLTAS